MKETFLKTVSFDEVEATVREIRSRKVTDTDTEKPVTKKMLKEQYFWDECLAEMFMCLPATCMSPPKLCLRG